VRHLRRVTTSYLPGGFLLGALASLFVVTACSLPNIKIEKKSKAERGDEVASLSTTPGTKPVDKRYLATVHVRFSEAKDATAISFDVRRDKRKMIVAKLWESEETVTTMHLGYTRSDGAIAGFKFNWRF
jgi:hypothetical protein